MPGAISAKVKDQCPMNPTDQFYHRQILQVGENVRLLINIQAHMAHVVNGERWEFSYSITNGTVHPGLYYLDNKVQSACYRALYLAVGERTCPIEGVLKYKRCIGTYCDHQKIQILETDFQELADKLKLNTKVLVY